MGGHRRQRRRPAPRPGGPRSCPTPPTPTTPAATPRRPHRSPRWCARPSATTRRCVLKSGGVERTYSTLSALEYDALHARIWGGLHFRDAMEDGYLLGHTTAAAGDGRDPLTATPIEVCAPAAPGPTLWTGSGGCSCPTWCWTSGSSGPCARSWPRSPSAAVRCRPGSSWRTSRSSFRATPWAPAWPSTRDRSSSAWTSRTATRTSTSTQHEGAGPLYVGVMHWSRAPLQAEACEALLPGLVDGVAIGFRSGPEAVAQVFLDRREHALLRPRPRDAGPVDARPPAAPAPARHEPVARLPHGAGAPGAPRGRGRALQRRDRPGALHRAEHGPQAPRARLPQARGHQPARGGRRSRGTCPSGTTARERLAQYG